jgi:hypothetical protein
VSALDNSDAGYRRIKAANWSIVKLMDSPAKARWTIDNPNAGDTASRGMLRAVHTLTLEPDVFERDYAVCDMRRMRGRRRTRSSWPPTRARPS